LSAASNDLFVARRTDGLPVDEAAEALEAETERVCEFADELASLARNLGTLAGARLSAPASGSSRAQARGLGRRQLTGLGGRQLAR
jgi:hypothetical protein